ncbi:universal stress protein [Loigolactobacillus backii]|uniref:universal stress protein n=1 Tax=Loigolactobacillus backii TaxID=375175 RepID=UPI000C1CA009|nr:universal stress protein [Loigolactobacillus backii]MDA5388329.1 universal stress protein [Loigolactobacillus backii]MDA5390825.1 universal stress protein [Loigolactobacillus backii]PIO83292.1 hypothetical protein BSQ39_06855 [Loigolactobacillus backii]
MAQAYQNILVAIDGSKQAHNAFLQALQTARTNHGHIFLLTVLDIWNEDYHYDFKKSEERDNYTDRLVKKTQKQLNGLKEEAANYGFTDLDIHIRFGNPKTVIAHDFTIDHAVDLILLGPTGKGVVARALVGSTASYVVRSASCDVLISHFGN